MITTNYKYKMKFEVREFSGKMPLKNDEKNNISPSITKEASKIKCQIQIIFYLFLLKKAKKTSSTNVNNKY